MIKLRISGWDTHGKDEEYVLKFSWTTWGRNTTGKTQALIGDRIEIDLKEMVYEDMDWIRQAPDGVYCQAFVNVTVNI
jgi:hypothetical protein